MNLSSSEASDKNVPDHSSRSDRLKQIDALYQSQIKQIYNESAEAIKNKQIQNQLKKDQGKSTALKKVSSGSNLHSFNLKEEFKDLEVKNSRVARSPEFDSRINKLILPERKQQEEKVRASVYLQGESTRTIEILRKQNETKELKIRELTNKCENLIDKLRNHLSPQEMDQEMESLKQFSDRKMQRLQNLFKIKNEEIFFKIKLQIIGLLQQFQVPKEDISGINEVNTESALFSFMVRKLKLKLKDFRSKEQQSNFQIQKDKILNQKYEERIHYLMETNELLKLSETKLKNKIEDLRGQLNLYIDKIKLKEKEVEEKQSEVFRIKKQNQQLQANNQKLTHQQRNASSQRGDEKRIYEAKQKQMKALLSSYFLERKKLESELEEKEGEIQEILIRQKFLQQENQRINREFVRWKERYEWLQKQKQNRQRQFDEQKVQLMAEFEEYKLLNNQGLYMSVKTETDEAIRKVEEYQAAYQKIMLELDEERKLNAAKQDEAQRLYEQSEKQWLDKIKRIQKMREQQIYELASDHENRQKEIREQYEKRQELLAEQMQARMKALLAENDKKATERLIQIETENDELRRQIDSLNKVIDVKESLIHVINERGRRAD